MSEASLVERLRARFVQSNPCYLDGLSKEAADAIDSLTAEVAGLRAENALLRRNISGAYETGWRMAAVWAERDDLTADIASPAYERDKAEALGPAVEPTTCVCGDRSLPGIHRTDGPCYAE